MDLQHALRLIQDPHAAIGAIGAFSALLGLALVLHAVRTPLFIGLVGELRIRMITRFGLDRSVYVALHDVTLAMPDGTTQIDHILVSRFGVFVIETKNMKGRIRGRPGDRMWMQCFVRRRHAFLNPMWQNDRHLKAVESVLGLDGSRLHSIVVFVGSAAFDQPMPANVVDLRDFARTVKARTTVLMSEAEAQEAVRRLGRDRIPRWMARWVHLKDLRRRRARAAASRNAGSVPIVRTSRVPQARL
ncbi:MAG: NERD domain-containing protein [Alphaproteobacteria bacterium]|nr:NERD domain-containing protein [Alphaproteobacteria bacterium]